MTVMFKFTGFTEKANKSLNAAVKAAEDLGHTLCAEHLSERKTADTTETVNSNFN